MDAFHDYGMELALREAELARKAGEVPAGCVILRPPPEDSPFLHPSLSVVLGRAHNQTESLCDPTAHAEMLAITQAATAVGDWRLTDAVLFVTKEPCAMCAGAIVLARIRRVVWGVSDARRGGHSVFGILDHEQLNHRVEIVAGVQSERCHAQLTGFFRELRGGGGIEN